LLTQLDLADSLPDVPADYAERRERLTVVAVGAGYTGTETVAQLQRWIHTVASRWNRVRPSDVRWLLIDVASSVLPELGPELGEAALGALRRRGIDVRLGVTVESATDRSVTLTDGTTVPARTLIWGAGVTANPLVATLGLELRKGRLVVDAQLRVPGTEHVWAAGDAAAVPDLTQPSTDSGDASAQQPVTPPTAQHAQRQGLTLARNVAASIGIGRARAYRHRDLGLVADLGGRDAVAKPLGRNVTGLAAKVVTRAYHLYALPLNANRVRVAVDWLLAAALPVQAVQLSEIRSDDALISNAEHTDIY
jgi:NADH dehydrogenase